MRRIFIISAVTCMFWFGASAKSVTFSINFTNPSDYNRTDIPFTVDELPEWTRSAMVVDGGREIPSQIDDLNADGIPDILSFVIDMSASEKRPLKVVFSDVQVPINRYPSRVHAQMFLKDGDKIVEKKVISATEDNMYNKLHHHGPAFESELMAYRIYFDKKQTTDMYGKYEKGLELERSMWYPTDEQLAEGLGDDIIRVFGSVGVGALKGWNAEKGEATHIAPIIKREARIVAKGPVRTVVDMKIEGWDYRGRKIDMTSRYILYAGHRDVEVQNTIKGDINGLTFATGVMKMAEQITYNDSKGAVAVWGTDYPVNDTVKFAKQTCGLAVSIPSKYIKEQREDKLNNLYILEPDANGRIDYRISVAAKKENFGYKSAEEFFDYVKQWAADTWTPSLTVE